MESEATHVCFINDRLRPGMPGRTVLMPLKMLLREYAFRHGAGIIDLRTHRVAVGHRRIVSTSRAELPSGQPRDRCGEWIEEKLVGIETMAVLGLIRAVHAVGIELTGTDPLHPNVPHVTSAVGLGIQINHPGWRGILGMIKQLQPNAAGVTAEEGEVDSPPILMGSHG